MKKFNLSLFVLALCFGVLTMFSCSDKDQDPDVLVTTPLYDTLGWFIQGATGPVEGNGIKMIADPDNAGQMIQAGRLAIRVVTEKSLMVIAADPELNIYFPVLLAELGASNTTGYANLLKSFTDFVQQAVSGQKIYVGKDMKTAHNNATYTRFGSSTHPTSNAAEFDKFIGDVAQAATSLNVPNSVIAQLGALLNTTRGDIVY